ncbi:MAG TPA: OsmC family protein [Melioribacteraceae bacterium]|nr:OsmC family protein [Melioribacteraceae bacterium]
MSNVLSVSVKRIDDKIKFEGVVKNNPVITVDYPEPYGRGEGYTSLELLLISLCTCSASSITLISKKMQKSIEDFKVEAIGIRRTEHPIGFENIKLNFIIKSNNLLNEDIDKAIKISEDSLCPVWNMLKNSVKIECNYSIIS